MSHSEFSHVDGDGNLVPIAAKSEPSAARVFYPPPGERDVDADVAQGSFLYYVNALRRRKWTLLAAALVGAVFGYLLTLAQTPIYRARVSLEILGINENFLNMRDVNPTSGTPSSPEVDLQTHAKLLQSQSVLASVISRLKLDAPEAKGSGSGYAAAFRKKLGLAAPPAFTPEEEQLRLASRNLTVRVHPNTRLIEAFYESPDPRLAANFANTLGEAYIEQNLQARWQTTQQTGEWLTRQMQELKTKLERSDDQLQAYGRSHGLQFTNDRENVLEEKLRQLQQELSRAQSDRIEKQSKYELLSSSPADALPEVVDNQTLREYRVKLADLNREIAELSATLTPANPKVRKLEAQAASMKASLDKERANIVERIRHEYEAARRRESLLASDYGAHSRLVGEQGTHISRYNILKREVDTTRQVYESMVQRVKEASVASALRASNIRVVDRARPPIIPHSPSGLLNTSLGLLAGALLGFALVVVRERADRRVQEPGETARCLNAVELAVIPSGKPDHHAGGTLLEAAQAWPAPSAHRGLPLLSSPPRPSAYAESFRAAVTSILFSGQNGSHPKVLVITSAGPDEGKTTVICNLAVALAEVNRRVLLVDGDLRKPRLHEIFGLENSAGLSDCLRESGEPRIIAEKTPVPNLSVLPAGTAGNTHLLYSPRLAQLIGLARQQADIVLIDTPPMLQMADARVLARCADAVVLIVRAERTTMDAALLARQRFAEDGTRVLGTILNDWNPANTTAQGYRKYYETYQRYYSKA